MIDPDKQIKLSIVDPHCRGLADPYDPKGLLVQKSMKYMEEAFVKGHGHPCQMFPKGVKF